MVTVGMNGLITSEETQALIRSRHPGYSEHTFRNHINLKHLRPAKRIQQGRRTVLFFDMQGIESYLRYLSERKIKTGAKIKNPDVVKYEFDLFKNRLDVLLTVFTKEELDEKLKSVIDDVYGSVKSKLDDIEKQKQKLVQDLRNNVSL